ncbi:4-dihydrotrisporin dehydrogenase [Endogone sp. FLAS-F59071]|nr:4-dihydrotrisporin dehydrogenase [Endogone sp. FLAS-F59071]|eukprot:RUS21664.1 4-dihydrotrisporin dehydrogenase [Endogone sp. FLAS-F59071]
MTIARARHHEGVSSQSSTNTPTTMAQSTLTFLITGASRGLGLEFVRQLSQKNHTILAGVRSPAHADELQIISSTFSNVHVFQIDTADDQSIKAAVGEVERLSPAGIDILINKPKEDLEQVFTTNVAGTLIVTNAFLPALLKRPTRKIINISSNLGSITRAWAGVKTSYRVSKAALNMRTYSNLAVASCSSGMCVIDCLYSPKTYSLTRMSIFIFNLVTRCYALDLLSEKFTVLALHPGWVQTDMGGKSASISPPESISGMLQVIEKVTAADSGKFLDYQGSSLPW